ARRHTGFLDMNQGSANQDIWPQVAAPPLLAHWNGSHRGGRSRTMHEMTPSCVLGRRLVDLVQTDDFPAQYKQKLRWPPGLMIGKNTPPCVDYACRATTKSMNWREEMCPLLFAAHFCPLEDGETPSPSMQMAATFRPMISLLILYYLDTRTKIDDLIPPWMILFGITYDRNGLVVWGHTPWSQQEHDGESRWSAKIWNLSDTYSEILRVPPSDRGTLLSMLNRIQGHCQYVLQQLKTWDGYDR
ncbi:hypothetical protein M408DRAFT_41217, partial [Serendipita vermifera MAFF 305830]